MDVWWYTSHASGAEPRQLTVAPSGAESPKPDGGLMDTHSQTPPSTNRSLVIEDALSPLIERAKIALGRFPQCTERFFAQPPDRQRAEDWAAILADGHPTRQEIVLAFRGRGLGSVSPEEVRAVIIQALLRDLPEMTHAADADLPPQQQLARTVATWIMEAFDEACWMTEDEAETFIVGARPHTVAG